MSPEPSCVVKIRRGLKLLEELHTKCGTWNRVQPKMNPCVVELDANAPDYSLIKTNVAAPPTDDFAAVIGDCVQNFRSALDHLTFALAEKHSGSLSKEDARACQFPVVGDETKKGQTGAGPAMFRDQAIARDIKGLSPAAQTIIEGLQPYQLGANFRAHPLWVLTELSNTDKHRFIHVVSWKSKVLGLSPVRGFVPADFPPGANEMKIEVYECAVEGETVIARVPNFFLNIFEKDADMHVKIDAGLIVAFKDGDLMGKDVTAELGTIHDYLVGNVLPPLLTLL